MGFFTTVNELFPGKNKVTLRDFESQLGMPTYPMWSKSEAAWVQVDRPLWRIFSVHTNDDVFPAEEDSEVTAVVYQARLIIGDELRRATQFKLQLEYHDLPWNAGATQ